jgi:hypothetical protein
LNEEAAEIFGRLVAERGGSERFDVTALAAARKLAKSLASDESNPAIISALSALLPAKIPTTSDWNMSLLTDDEIQALDYLARRAHGLETEPFIKRVVVEYVDAPVERCPKCGWHRGEPASATDMQTTKPGLSDSDRIKGEPTEHTISASSRTTPIDQVSTGLSLLNKFATGSVSERASHSGRGNRADECPLSGVKRT